MSSDLSVACPLLEIMVRAAVVGGIAAVCLVNGINAFVAPNGAAARAGAAQPEALRTAGLSAPVEEESFLSSATRFLAGAALGAVILGASAGPRARTLRTFPSPWTARARPST